MIDEDTTAKFRTLAEKSDALCAALDEICRWTGTDWIGSHVRRCIEEVRATLADLHGTGRNLPLPPPVSDLSMQIRRLEVKDGDTLVLKPDTPFTDEQISTFKRLWNTVNKGSNVALVVLDPGTEISVLRQAAEPYMSAHPPHSGD